MAYITGDDIATTYTQLFLNRITKTPPNGVADPVVIQRGIDAAEEIINAYLSARYNLPMAVVPGILKQCAVDIAVYKIAMEQAQRSEEMRLRYQDAISMLKGMGAGTVGLGLSPADMVANGNDEDPRVKMSRSINTYRN